MGWHNILKTCQGQEHLVNLHCLLAAFYRCLGFSVSSQGLNLGMDDIISQIHPKVVPSLTLAFGPALPFPNSTSNTSKMLRSLG